VDASSLFERRYKWFEKKRPRELKAMLVNLHKLKSALDDGVVPNLVTGGFVHREPRGVIAIDQSGCEGAAQEMRLYVYPKNSTIHLITIGDKQSQQADLKDCDRFVEQLRRSR